MNPAVRFENVSKRYELGSYRSYLRYLLPDAVRRWSAIHRRKSKAKTSKSRELWALKDFSLDIQPGEVLGLIGGNGAGKTTTLSLLAGVTSPTSGTIYVRGRVGALIKLGAGFHPDLSGRENIYLNGAIYGLRKAEIDRCYDEIVEFSGIEDFLETPVKRYSAGMFVRLGFSVAVHMNPDILLVDEVLSVGDISFRARCFNRIGKIRESGTTILLVSHSTHHIAGFSDRVVYLDHGRIKSIGKPEEVLQVYTADMMTQADPSFSTDEADTIQANGTGRMVITGVSFRDQHGSTVERIQGGNPVTLRVHYQSQEEIENPVLDLVIRDGARGNLFQATNQHYGIEFGRIGRTGYFEIVFDNLNSNNQLLTFLLSLWNSKRTELFDWKRNANLYIMGNPVSGGRMMFDCSWKITREDTGVTD